MQEKAMCVYVWRERDGGREAPVDLRCDAGSRVERVTQRPLPRGQGPLSASRARRAKHRAARCFFAPATRDEGRARDETSSLFHTPENVLNRPTTLFISLLLIITLFYYFFLKID